ncbi:MAG: hypothetical protein KAW41_02810 [Candidatus Diapherotrites archaeon]|nr:hypothetical protein [Candidatus Diapherotrites archaeon]
MVKGKTFHQLHKEGAFEAPARADTKNAKVPSGVVFDAHTGEGSGWGGSHRINKGLREGVEHAPSPSQCLKEESYDDPYTSSAGGTPFSYGQIYEWTDEISGLSKKWHREYMKLFSKIDDAEEYGEEGEELEQKKAELAGLKNGMLQKLKKIKREPLKLNDVLDCDSKEDAYYMTFDGLSSVIKGDERGAPVTITLVLRKKSCDWVIKKLGEGYKIHDIIKHYAPRLSKELFKVVSLQHPENPNPYERPGTIELG